MTTLHDEFQEASHGIIAHVNDDHRDAMLKLVHAFGEQTWASDAELIAITPEQMTLCALSEEREETVGVAFNPALTKVNQVRQAMIQLIAQADTILDNASS
ncbi:MAG: DUF2470 domain-containing protein [Chloroflexota bacterium]